jgi:hypothetical protein
MASRIGTALSVIAGPNTARQPSLGQALDFAVDDLDRAIDHASFEPLPEHESKGIGQIVQLILGKARRQLEIEQIA